MGEGRYTTVPQSDSHPSQSTQINEELTKDFHRQASLFGSPTHSLKPWYAHRHINQATESFHQQL